MEKIRVATIDDKDSFKSLWKICFNDSDNFLDWFFNNRFVPEYSACLECDGKIVSAMQSIPMHIQVRGTILSCTMLAGVSTNPDYGGRGYMKKMFSYYMNMVNKMGIVLTPHTPARINTFFPLGHYTVSDSSFIDIENVSPTVFTEKLTIVDLNGSVSCLYSCYNKVSLNYSGIINRSLADFEFKCRDYSSDNALCAAYVINDTVVGYCIYFSSMDIVYGEEVISINDTVQQCLVDYLTNIAFGKKLHIKLPADTKIKNEFVKTIPHSVLGVANVSKLLKALGGGKEFSILVNDAVVNDNNGVFNLKGELTQSSPQISISAGHLIQWLTGYKTLYELSDENNAKILDLLSGKELNELFPKIPCCIIDEY